MSLIAGEADPPLHLFLGGDAYEAANAKIVEVQKDLENSKTTATSTDFAVEAAA